jgi:hypothetical protein
MKDGMQNSTEELPLAATLLSLWSLIASPQISSQLKKNVDTKETDNEKGKQSVPVQRAT